MLSITRNRRSSRPTGDVAALAGVRVESSGWPDGNDLRSSVVGAALALPVRAGSGPEEACRYSSLRLRRWTRMIPNRVIRNLL